MKTIIETITGPKQSVRIMQGPTTNPRKYIYTFQFCDHRTGAAWHTPNRVIPGFISLKAARKYAQRAAGLPVIGT